MPRATSTTYFGGFRVYSSGDVLVGEGLVGEGTTAVENTGFDFCLESHLETTVHDALAENNLGNGFNDG